MEVLSSILGPFNVQPQQELSLIAIDKDSILFYCKDNTIFAIDLNGKQAPSSIRILWDVPFGFQVHKLLFNFSTKYLCLVSSNVCAVLEVDAKVRAEIRLGKKVLQCRSFIVGEYFHTNHPSVLIHSVSWHPVSDHHLAILTNDNAIRLHNVEAEEEDAEQIFKLKPASSSDDNDEHVVDFCFGSKYGWNRFTLFLLSSSGNIYTLCPIVPFNCIIPENYFRDLSDIVLQSEYESYIEYVNQWLRKIQAQTFSDQSDMKWIRTRLVTQTLAVQGPFTSFATTEASKIISIPTFPAVLLILHENGTVNILVQISTSFPRWANQREVEQPEIQFILYDSVSLSTNQPLHPAATVLMKDKVLICTWFGIYLLHLPWIANVEQLTNSQEPRPTVDLESTVVHCILNTAPLPSSNAVPVIGHAVLENKLICLPANNSCLVIPLDQFYQLDSESAVNLPSTSEHINKMASFADDIRSLFPQGKPFKLGVLPTLSSSNMNDAAESLEFLNNTCTKLQQSVVVIQKLHAQIASRMVQLEQVISTQNQELQQLISTVNATQTSTTQLKTKLDRVKQFHEMLVDRVAAQLQILNAAVNNNDLSQAEREWLTELKHFRNSKIPGLLAKIEEYQMQAEKIAAVETKEQSAAIDNKRLQNIEPILADQSQKIKTILQDLQNLETHVQEEFFPTIQNHV